MTNLFYFIFRFLLELSDIPDFANRVFCITFQASFEENLTTIRSRLTNVCEICEVKQGRIQDFHLGGGGGAQQIKCHKHEAQSPYGRNPALGVFDALSCYLEPYFSAFWYKMGLRKHSLSNFREGGGVHACCAPF